MKRRLLFLLAVFAATTLLMALQKPVFLLFHAAQAAESTMAERLLVLWHGLSLDMTVAGYVTALPLLATLASLWVSLPDRVWHRRVGGGAPGAPVRALGRGDDMGL